MAFSLQSVSFLLSLIYRVGEWLCEDSSDAELRRYEADSAQRRRRDQEQGQGLLEGAEPATAEPAAAAVATWRTLGLYFVLSLLIAAANSLATVALHFVSMQTKVLFKSSKIVTVMLLGTLLFRKVYAAAEYAYMALVVLGLAAFTLANSSAGSGSSLVGVALLTLAVLCDSLVPNVQQTLLRTRPKQELIFHTNWVSALLTLGYMTATGEVFAAVHYLARHRRVLGLLLVQSVAGYCGILAYLETVRSFGPKVTTIVTSCRKLFTIGLSSLAFGHPLSGFHVAGVLAVFCGVTLNAYRDRACSRLLVLPALLAMVVLVALELRLDAGANAATYEASRYWSMPLAAAIGDEPIKRLAGWLRAIRAALGVRVM